MGLLRLVFILILFYFLWKLITVFIIYPFAKGYSGNTGNRGRNGGFKNSRKREGDITIDYVSKHKKRFNKDEAEYIEYEEMDD